MSASIGRSVVEGFRAANRSWIGIGFVAGCWLALLLAVLAIFSITRPPRALFEEPAAEQAVAPPPAPAVPNAPASDTATVDVFAQMAATGEATPPVPAAPPAPDPQEAARQRGAERDRVIGEWFGHVWPLALIVTLGLIAASTWLSAGQIGYLAKHVTAPPARLTEFWESATRSFWPCLGASCLWLLMVGGLLGAAVLLIGIGAALSQILPPWVLVLLGVVALGALIGAMIYFGIRLSLWTVAVVADRTGPIAGLKASLRATRGRWWTTCWLVVLLMLINVGIQLACRLLLVLSGSPGGAIGVALIIATMTAYFVASFYVGFADLAALVRFYEDTKASPAATAGGRSPQSSSATA